MQELERDQIREGMATAQTGGLSVEGAYQRQIRGEALGWAEIAWR
jgi:hypothetical protein